jgi:hypothetical protein
MNITLESVRRPPPLRKRGKLMFQLFLSSYIFGWGLKAEVDVLTEMRLPFTRNSFKVGGGRVAASN